MGGFSANLWEGFLQTIEYYFLLVWHMFFLSVWCEKKFLIRHRYEPIHKFIFSGFCLVIDRLTGKRLDGAGRGFLCRVSPCELVFEILN